MTPTDDNSTRLPQEAAPAAADPASQAAHMSEWELRDFLDNAAVGLHWVGPDGTILWANRSELELLGYTPEEYVGRHIAEFHADAPVIADILERLTHNETLHNYEARLRCKDGSVRHVLISSNVLWKDGRFLHTRCFTRDITDRKLSEEALRQKQADVEALNARLRRAMQETHHRVRNNLQIIGALVDMQLIQGGEAVPAEELRRLGHHVRSLAAVHDLLTHQAQDDAEVEHIPAQSALEILLPLVQAMAGGRSVRFDIAPVRLPVRQGTSLAILVNELVGNAIRHGRGDILLTLAADENSLTLTVSDHGPGFPADFDPLSSAHTGLELIESMARWDLRGDIAYTNLPSGGASVIVTFPLTEGSGAG